MNKSNAYIRKANSPMRGLRGGEALPLRPDQAREAWVTQHRARSSTGVRIFVLVAVPHLFIPPLAIYNSVKLHRSYQTSHNLHFLAYNPYIVFVLKGLDFVSSTKSPLTPQSHYHHRSILTHLPTQSMASPAASDAENKPQGGDYEQVPFQFCREWYAPFYFCAILQPALPRSR